MLSLAGLVSRLLGAAYKPVIVRLFAPYDGKAGAIGAGLTQVPLTTYMVILSFTSVGLNVGISRLVAERMALGDARGARRVFRVSLVLMGALGLVSSVLLWFGAPYIAGFFSKDLLETVPGFRATAPALFVVSIMAAYRGLFQGFQQMSPNAYSQIIEQVVRVAAGIVLTLVVLRQTSSVPLGAAAFNFGDVLGAVAGLVYLLLLVRSAGRSLWRASPEEAATIDASTAQGDLYESPGALVRRILAVAAPVAIAGAVVPLMMQADTFFVFRAMEQAGVGKDDAQAAYGLLTNAFMITYLPSIFTAAIYTSILPAITHAMTQGRLDVARTRSKQAYRMTLALAAPAQAGLYVLAAGVYALIYGDAAGGSVMAALSWSVVPIMLQQTTSGVLQGAGRIALPVRNFVIGALVKMGLTAWWTLLWGINGAAYATAVGFLVAALLNLVDVERRLGRTLQTRSMIFKPVLASLAMAGAIAGLRQVVPEGHLATLGLIAAGGVVYGIAMLLVGGLRRQELEMIPKVGHTLAGLLARTRLLR